MPSEALHEDAARRRQRSTRQRPPLVLMLPWEEEQPPLLPWEEEKEQGPPPLLQPGEHPGRLPPAQLHLDALELPEERQAPAQQGSALLHLALVQAWAPRPPGLGQRVGCHVVLRVQALAERAHHPNQKCQPKLRVSGVLAWVSRVLAGVSGVLAGVSGVLARHLQVAAASLVASARCCSRRCCSRPALVAGWRDAQNYGRRLALLLHRRRRGERPIQPPAQLLSWASHLSNKSVVRKNGASEVVGSQVDPSHSML